MSSCPSLGNDFVNADWYEWLVLRATVDSEALELLSLYEWSSTFWGFGIILEDFMERRMQDVLCCPGSLSQLLHMVVQLYVKELGVVDCLAAFGSNLVDFPVLYEYVMSMCDIRCQ